MLWRSLTVVYHVLAVVSVDFTVFICHLINLFDWGYMGDDAIAVCAALL